MSAFPLRFCARCAMVLKRLHRKRLCLYDGCISRLSGAGLSDRLSERIYPDLQIHLPSGRAHPGKRQRGRGKRGKNARRGRGAADAAGRFSQGRDLHAARLVPRRRDGACHRGRGVHDRALLPHLLRLQGRKSRRHGGCPQSARETFFPISFAAEKLRRCASPRFSGRRSRA